MARNARERKNRVHVRNRSRTLSMVWKRRSSLTLARGSVKTRREVGYDGYLWKLLHASFLVCGLVAVRVATSRCHYRPCVSPFSHQTLPGFEQEVLLNADGLSAWRRRHLMWFPREAYTWIVRSRPGNSDSFCRVLACSAPMLSYRLQGCCGVRRFARCPRALPSFGRAV